jgi:hypothetical protein
MGAEWEGPFICVNGVFVCEDGDRIRLHNEEAHYFGKKSVIE